MASQRVLGVAVIGTGKMGADHVRRLQEVVSGARVTAVVDIEADRAKSLADVIEGCTAYTEPAAALAAPNVDAVLIASPGPAHESALIEAIGRDLPVLCEKPMTPDTDSALRVLEAEQRLGRRRVQVGFMRRYDTDYAKLKRLLDGGELGRALMLHQRHRNLDMPPGFTDEMLISSSVSHEVDATRWLLGQEITAVTVHKPTPTSHAPTGMNDPQFILFETASGALVDVEIFGHCGYGYQVQAEAVCERGTVRIGDEPGPRVSAAGRWGGHIPADYIERFEDAYDREVQAWVDAARGGETTGPSSWDGYAASAVCEAGVLSQREGGRVEVGMLERPGFYE
ncbi:Gfo/Idh/MocA family protein [Streptomyces longisporoflavus]|uniref:Gfo/Idh/MocA family protein n=1 Tax=Streptomyces longisporoflavus TaxID=28044 RepID=UPI00167DB7A6|nr:Gfo/Idh/MocA family oxidoreductase [Streptomyces longisporoflavus]